MPNGFKNAVVMGAGFAVGGIIVGLVAALVAGVLPGGAGVALSAAAGK